MPFASETGFIQAQETSSIPHAGPEAEADIHSSSFFNMPSAIADKEYIDKSNTEVAWTPGFFGLIKFVAWEDFDKKVWSNGMRSFREIPEDMTASSKATMEVFRSEIVDGNRDELGADDNTAELSSDGSVSEESSEDGNESAESAPDNDIEQGDVGVFTNCASVKTMMDHVIWVVQSLLKASLSTDPRKRKYYIRCKNELDISTLRLKNALGYNFQLATPQNIRVNTGVVLGVFKEGRKRKTPDSPENKNALTSFNVGGILPICNFKMKGPTLYLTGIAAISKVKISDKASKAMGRANAARNTEGGLNAQASNTQNTANEGSNAQGTANEARSTDDDGSEAGNRDGSVNESGNRRAGGHTTSDVSGGTPVYTAGEVAEAFNFLFSESKFINKRSKIGGPIRSSIYRISQAVTYAVLSLGRCSFLYNLQSGIGFHIVDQKDKVLTVEVTGVLLPDKAPNCGSAMFSIAKYCMDQYFAYGAEHLSAQVRAVARQISDRAFNQDPDDPETDDSEYSPAEGKDHASDSTTSSDENTRNRDGAEQRSDSQRNLGLSLKPLRIQNLTKHPKSKVRASVISENYETTKVNRTIDESIKDMFMNFEAVVGRGSSAVVMKSRFLKTDVAVKIPFDSSAFGKHSLAHEIETYIALNRDCSPLLGDILPRLLLSWNSPQQCSVYAHMMFLVTEFRSRSNSKQKRSALCGRRVSSGYEVLNEEEEQQIRKSAIAGLRKMRKFGLCHGDIALRNLRVERTGSQLHCEWKTWWVDLGCSRLCKSSTKFTFSAGITSLYDTDVAEASLIFNF